MSHGHADPLCGQYVSWLQRRSPSQGGSGFTGYCLDGWTVSGTTGRVQHRCVARRDHPPAGHVCACGLIEPEPETYRVGEATHGDG